MSSSNSNSISKLDPNFAPVVSPNGLQWFDIRAFGIEGRGWKVEDLETDFDRLPARAKGVVRPLVWVLSQNSAGLGVRFVTDASQISAKWTLRSANLSMHHMPASAMSGLDLYAKIDGRWVWAGVGMPTEVESDLLIASGLLPGMHEYLLYLPLYNGIEKISLGFPVGAQVEPAPRRVGTAGKGVVVYGTSIVQGGCASRSGMAYPAILSRSLDCEMVNLGFSGHGPMDLELADLLGELDPAVFVIDSLPNMSPAMVNERAVTFITKLRTARPNTPIVVVESITLQHHLARDPKVLEYEAKNANLRRAMATLKERGVTNLHYIEGKNLLGDDTLGTVDGVHPTDLGFFRMANEIEKTLKPLLI